MKRTLKISFEFLAAFVATVLIAFLLLAWRVASQPISSTTLTPYVVMALDKLVPGTHAEIGHTLIVWDNDDHTIALRGDDVKLRDDKSNVIADFPSMKLRMSLLSLLRGRFLPDELSIEQPQLWLVRRADGTILFTAMATGNAAPPPEAATERPLMEFLQRFTEEITHNGLLRDLAVTKAKLFIHDEETKQDWSVGIPEIALHHGLLSLTGNAEIELTQKDHTSLLMAHYEFDQRHKLHDVSVSFSDVNPSFLAGRLPKLASMAALNLPLTGEISFTADPELNVVTTSARIEGGEGQLNVPDFWDAPRPVKHLALAATYDRAAHRLDMPVAEIDMGGPKLAFKMEASQPPVDAKAQSGKPFDMAFTLNIKLTDLPMDDFAAVWPKPIITNAREWISSNMSAGAFKQGEITLRGKFAWDDLENMDLDSGEGTVSASGARVKYIAEMPQVEGVGAEATFDLDHMDVKVSGGGIGALKLQTFTILITDFQQHVQNIFIPLTLAGPVRDVVKLLDSPPLGYAKVVGLRPDDSDGNVTGVVELRFPLLNALAMKDIGIKADANLTDFGAKKLIPGIEIARANLALALDKEGFTLKGPATLNKVPLQVNAQENFGEPANNKPHAQATVTGAITGEQWAQFGLDLSGRVKGPTAVTLRVTQPDKDMTQLSGEIGLRQAAIQFDEMNWKKPAGVQATLNLAADMPQGKDIQVKAIDLQGTGIKVKGSARLASGDQRLMQLDLKPLILGRTNASLHFTQSPGAAGALRFSAEGESFDVSGLRGGKDPAKTDPRPKNYDIRVNKLYTSEDGFIANASIHAQREQFGWSAIELHGLADGGHQLDISLAPLGDRRTFSITCDDFGKALKGMGFTDTVKSGALEIKGESSPDNPRVIEGTAKIGSFVVAGLPVLARLLSAMSPFGFVDFITGNAYFDRLEGQFRWHGDEVELSKVRAAGSTFGLNIDGRVDLNTGEANLHGTVVPFSFFNKVINIIPLLGNVITGGEGQGVIAASYTVKGTLLDPNISVNPVSLLTPGFLRNLFFSGDDTEQVKPQAPAEQKPKAPQEIDKK
jgi:hypothetical protein